MATLVKRISWDKIRVGDRIMIEEGTDTAFLTVAKKFGDYLMSESGADWFDLDNARFYRMKEDS